MKQKGILLVVSGPSGAGKGTICNALLKKYPGLCYSVSATTRAPRNGEVDGENYFFLAQEKFKEMIKKDQLLEYAHVYDNYYGTPRSYIEEKLQQGFDILLEIEMDGAQQIREKVSDAVFVFIMPPSLEELSVRINRRGKDSEEVIAKRMKAAADEVGRAVNYDYIILNNDLQEALAQTHAIIVAEKAKAKRNSDLIEKIRSGK